MTSRARSPKKYMAPSMAGISAITTSSMMERVLSGECTWGEQDMVRLMVSLSM